MYTSEGLKKSFLGHVDRLTVGETMKTHGEQGLWKFRKNDQRSEFRRIGARKKRWLAEVDEIRNFCLFDLAYSCGAKCDVSHHYFYE